MSAGETPAVLFYLLDRHALLAMTMGTKCVFLNALPHPPPQNAAAAAEPLLAKIINCLFVE